MFIRQCDPPSSVPSSTTMSATNLPRTCRTSGTDDSLIAFHSAAHKTPALAKPINPAWDSSSPSIFYTASLIWGAFQDAQEAFRDKGAILEADRPSLRVLHTQLTPSRPAWTDFVSGAALGWTLKTATTIDAAPSLSRLPARIRACVGGARGVMGMRQRTRLRARSCVRDHILGAVTESTGPNNQTSDAPLRFSSPFVPALLPSVHRNHRLGFSDARAIL
ncbi:hypothetical protein BDK51DRAFT_48862 [Blyttiomyces helicus]|uniref:Uncharacterized protein n=1 Tax=Blyttiomyces helicus TaxID=388810 RepID=A0A4P9W1Y6_9FUNG|nr:hypothetical protein BDK51DRAFT_48862 [Blyttiomyces helicus]|eukprot:RKO84600.1 hypothetical protein BDK51DRAFT_48862 [Blyttiomyces helicus]